MKRSLRRGLAALLALALVLGACPADAAAASLDEWAVSAVSQQEEAETQTEDTDENADQDTNEDAGDDDQAAAEDDEPAADSAEANSETDQSEEEDADPAEEDEADPSEEEESAGTDGESSAGEETEEEEETEAETPAGEDEEEVDEEEDISTASATSRTAKYHRDYAEKGTTFRILLIGNSFSVDTSQYLYQVATDAGYDVVVGNLQRSSKTLANHWSYAKNNSAIYIYRKNSTGSWETTSDATMAQAVKDEDWDIIIFQQQSSTAAQASSFYDDSGNNYLTLLSNYVVKRCGNADVKIGFEMTWAYPSDSSSLSSFGGSQLTMYNRICSATKSAVVSSGAVDLIITAGTAIQNVRSSYIGDTLNRDGKHLKYGIGRYLAAMSVASACGIDISDITEINTGSYACSSLHLVVLKQAVADAEKSPYSVTTQTTTTPTLSRPTVTRVTSDDGTTTLTWNAVNGATGYQVYRMRQGGTAATLLTTLSTGKSSYSYSYTATGYNYYICALGDDYISDTVDSSARVTSRPTISSLANTSSGGLAVKWSAVSSVTGYQMQSATDSSFTQNLQTVSGTGTSKNTASRTNGTKYYVRVRAYKTVSGTTYYSAWSSTKSIYCISAPTLASVANASGSKLTVQWNTVSSVTSYQVQTATDSSFTKNVKTVSATGSSKTTSSLTNGTKYYVRVRACKNVSGTNYYSAWSSAKSIYCLSAPSISSLKNVKTRKLTVKWSKNTKATGYQIQYSTSSSFSDAKTVTVSSYKTVSKTIANLSKGKKYYVRVRAYKTVSGTNYYSVWSGQKSVKISK